VSLNLIDVHVTQDVTKVFELARCVLAVVHVVCCSDRFGLGLSRWVVLWLRLTKSSKGNAINVYVAKGKPALHYVQRQSELTGLATNIFESTLRSDKPLKLDISRS